MYPGSRNIKVSSDIRKVLLLNILSVQQEELTRVYEQEKRRLTESIQTLKREVQTLKHEQRENRDDRWRQEIEMKDNIERLVENHGTNCHMQIQNTKFPLKVKKEKRQKAFILPNRNPLF